VGSEEDTVSRQVAPLITLDTSALVSLLDRREPDHRRVRAAFVDDRGPYLIPVWILAEVSYVVAARLGSRPLDALVGDLETGAYTLDCGESDVARVRELVRRYADLPLSAADAAVVACAERNGGRILSVDTDFAVVAREGRITLLPS
jgi:predicted nucleic acid-binding protein